MILLGIWQGWSWNFLVSLFKGDLVASFQRSSGFVGSCAEQLPSFSGSRGSNLHFGSFDLRLRPTMSPLQTCVPIFMLTFVQWFRFISFHFLSLLTLLLWTENYPIKYLVHQTPGKTKGFSKTVLPAQPTLTNIGRLSCSWVGILNQCDCSKSLEGFV